MKNNNQQQGRKFKNQVVTVEELRRHRREETILLRKRKQDEEFNKLHKIGPFKEDEIGNFYTIFDEELMEKLNSTNEAEILNALRTYRHLINGDDCAMVPDSNTTLDDVISLGLLPVFVDLFNVSEPGSLVCSAALNLLKTVSNQPEYNEELFEYISLPKLHELFSSSSEEILRNLLSLINSGVFYWGSTREKFLVSECDVVRLTVNLFHKTTSPSLKDDCLILVRNFYRYFVDIGRISMDYLDLLKLIFGSTEVTDQMLAAGVYGLINIAEMSSEHIDLLVGHGLVTTVFSFLERNESLILSHTLNFIFVVACHEKFAPIFTQMNVFNTLWKMLERSNGSSYNDIRLSLSSTLAQILRLKANDHSFVLSSGYVPRFVDALLTGHYRIRCEAVMALHVLVMYGSEQTVRCIAESPGVLQAICDMLTVMDVETVLCCLECVDRVLTISEKGPNDYKRVMEEHGGVEKLEFLLNSQNLDVYIMAHDIVERFFDEDAIELDEAGDLPTNLLSDSSTNFDFWF